MTKALRKLFIDDSYVYGGEVRIWVWIVSALLAVGLFVVGIVFLIVQADRGACERKAQGLGRDWRFHWYEGCYFSDGDRFVPEDYFRVTDEGDE